MARYKLLNVMQEKGYTVQSLAKKINCSKTAVYYWVSGERRPYEHYMRKLAELFEMPVAEVVSIFWE